MTVVLSPMGGVAAQFFNNNGVPLSGGKIYTYEAGTTTPATTYTSSSGTTAHTNPIVLNSAGRVSTGEIWLIGTLYYKFALYDANNVLIATYDNIPPFGDAFQVIYTPPFTDSVSTTVGAKLEQTVSVKDFGAVGDGTTDDSNSIQAAENYASANSLAVRFPAGTYLCGSVIYRQGNTDWIGDGMQLSVLKHSGGSDTHHLVYVESVTTEYSHIGFYNMGFDGNRSGSVDPSANRIVVYLDRDSSGGVDAPSKDVRFIGCRLFNFSYGNMGLHIKGYTGVQVKDSVFEDGGSGLYHPIYLRRCADVLVTGNVSTGRDGNSCIKVQNSPQNVIANNICQNGARGIFVQDSQSATIDGNTIYDATLFGIDSTIEDASNSNDITVSGNTVYSSVGGIRLSNITVFAISGNNISGFSTNGINCRSSRDGSICGNTLFTSDSSSGEVIFIKLESGPVTSRVSISSNMLRTSRPSGGTTYGIWTDETTVTEIDLTVNAFSGATWTQKHFGIEPVLYADAATGVAVGYDSRAFDASLHEIHGTTDTANFPGYAAVNWRAANVAPSLTLAKSRSGTVGTNSSSVVTGDTLGLISFYGDHNSSFLQGVVIEATVAGVPTPSANTMPATLNIKTTPTGSATPVTRNKFNSNGSFNFVPIAQPSTAVAGDTYYDSSTNKLRCYNGTIWNDLF